MVSFCGCATRNGHSKVFLLLVFLVFFMLYCNTRAVTHRYMYSLFDILLYMFSVCGHLPGPDRMAIGCDHAGKYGV
jgi:hypothetical protein